MSSLKRNRGYRPRTHGMRKAFTAAATAALVKKAVNYMSSKRVKTEGGSNAITNQHDSKTLYRKRRTSRRTKMKFRRRAKSFLAKQLRVVNFKSNKFNLANATANAPDAQQIAALTVGAFSGPIFADQIGNLISLVQNDQNSVNVEYESFKYYLISMAVDYTFVNTGDGVMELDIYEWVARKDPSAFRSTVSTLVDLITDINAAQDVIGTGGTAITATTMGWTPFDTSMLCQYVLIKSKKRYYIGPNQAISYTSNRKFRKPFLIPMYKSNDITSVETENAELKWVPGITRGVILVLKGVPSLANPCADVVTLRWCAQCTYKFKNISIQKPQSELGSNV